MNADTINTVIEKLMLNTIDSSYDDTQYWVYQCNSIRQKKHCTSQGNYKNSAKYTNMQKM